MNFFQWFLSWFSFANRKETESFVNKKEIEKYLILKFLVPFQTVEKIKWLQQSSGSQTAAELVSTALTCYDHLLEVYMSGGQIIFKDINNLETTFIPFTKLPPNTNG